MTVDLGLARVDDSGDLPFVVLAGMGHDAATVAATNPTLKDRIGWPAYVAPAAVSALRRPVPVTVRHDGGDPEHLRVWSVLAANCTRVRAGVHIAPGGLVDDHHASSRHIGVALLPRAQLFGQFGVDRRAHLLEVEAGHLEGAG